MAVIQSSVATEDFTLGDLTLRGKDTTKADRGRPLITDCVTSVFGNLPLTDPVETRYRITMLILSTRITLH